MSNHGKLVSVEKRILLHLLNYQDSKNQYDVPKELTATGIAKALETNRTYVFTSFKKYVDMGYAQEHIGRVKNTRKKQKYFLLTDDGKRYALKLRKELSNLEITVKLSNGSLKTMKLIDIIPSLAKDEFCMNITEMDIYNNIFKEGILDINLLKNTRKTDYVDFSYEAPKVLYFYGRKNEISTLRRWIGDQKEYNIIFVQGMAGIGKTTLAARLIEHYRGSKHLFWHNFHELDTLRGVLFKLGEFLSKLGYDHLELYLRTRTTFDYHEISRILQKSIGKIDAILIFDDFQKSNDKTRLFFGYILKMLISSSKTKILILSREIIPFYDQRDVLIRRIVAELELEGLDFESSKKLLLKKGVEKQIHEEIFRFTAGNPLFLEIYESDVHIQRYIHNELFSKLDKDERKALEIMSIYRHSVPEDSLSVNDDFDYETHHALTQKSLIKKDAHNRFFIHDIIRQFFLSRMPSSKQIKYHFTAAKWYEEKHEPLDLLEAIYHYQEAEKYNEALQIVIDNSMSILEGGYPAEFLIALEKFDEERSESLNWAKILMCKGKAYSMMGEWKKALLAFTQSADISNIIDNKKLEVKAICESGHILEEQNELKRAMECFRKGLQLSKQTEYLKGKGECLRGMGRVHWRKGDYRGSISNFEKCLKILKKIKDQNLLASTYIDLGNVYDEMLEIERAVKYYHKALDILHGIKNTYETARAYANLAIAYRHMDAFDSAIEYHKKQLNLAGNLRDMKLIGYGYASLSYCYVKTHEFEKATKYAEKAEDIAFKIDNENILFQINRTNAIICKHEMKWEEAKAHFQKSIELAEKSNEVYSLSHSHQELGLMYKEIGDIKNAKKHLRTATNLRMKLDYRNKKIE